MGGFQWSLACETGKIIPIQKFTQKIFFTKKFFFFGRKGFLGQFEKKNWKKNEKKIEKKILVAKDHWNPPNGYHARY